MRYYAYFYVNGKTKRIGLSGSKDAVFRHARVLAGELGAIGYAIYKDDVLVGDWFFRGGKYYSNLPAKKKDKTAHPFGL